MHEQEDEATPVTGPVAAEGLASAKEGSRRWLRGWRRQGRPPPSSTASSKGAAEGAESEQLHAEGPASDAQAGGVKKGMCHFQDEIENFQEPSLNLES